MRSEVIVDLPLFRLNFSLQGALIEVFKVQKKQVVVNDVAVSILNVVIASLCLFHDPINLTDSFSSEIFDLQLVVLFDICFSSFLILDLLFLLD